MALVRWEPAREFTTLQSEMNRLFNTFFEGGPDREARRWAPPMDLMESEDHLILRADLPGLSEDDIQVEVRDNVLTLTGERKSEEKRENNGYYRIERAYGSFARSLTLPDGIDPGKIEASFDKGVLELRIPKPEERKPTRITIGRGSEETVEGTASEK